MVILEISLSSAELLSRICLATPSHNFEHRILICLFPTFTSLVRRHFGS